MMLDAAALERRHLILWVHPSSDDRREVTSWDDEDHQEQDFSDAGEHANELLFYERLAIRDAIFWGRAARREPPSERAALPAAIILPILAAACALFLGIMLGIKGHIIWVIPGAMLALYLLVFGIEQTIRLKAREN